MKKSIIKHCLSSKEQLTVIFRMSQFINKIQENLLWMYSLLKLVKIIITIKVMKVFRSFTQNSALQLKNLMPLLASSYVILFALLLFVALIGEYFHIPVSKFTRDPTHILNGHPFTGAISNIGILFWCATAAICFFSALIHWKNTKPLNSKFLLFSGLITLFLLLDDLFMFHEIIFPKYLHIPEFAVYSGYLALISIYLLKFKENILKTEYTLLYMALAFFALSMISDVFLLQEDMVYLVEDGFKLFGIVTWFLFFIRTCFMQTQKILHNKPINFE